MKIDFKYNYRKFFLSIIIPVLDDINGLKTTVYSILKNNNRNNNFYEIIVANDGGNEKINNFCKDQKIKFVSIQPVKGSYNARNEALKEASGEFIVFVDANIKVSKNWLDVGTNFLKRYDYVGGCVRIDKKKVKTIGHLYELATAFPVEQYIKNVFFAPTANLFVKRKVIEMIGGFDSDLFSGGDLEFGQRVRDCKFLKQTYAKDAYVFHPPRDLDEIIKKKKRVVAGKIKLYSKYPQRFIFLKDNFKKMILLGFMPPIFATKKIIKKSQTMDLKFNSFKVFFVIWYIKIRELAYELRFFIFRDK